ncbi:MAG: acetylxylan esterase [Verrucomicrobiales bacterium]|nr:acetylxylan esterase [Verrucomicrobiales bacterium]
MNHAAPAVPELAIPADVADWQQQREVLRATLWRLLGDLPPRPAPRPGEIRWRDRRETDDSTIESFEFDNGAGAVVPGVFILPKRRSGKVPGVLYCHWHGGEYDGGKKEVFEQAHTPAVPATEFAKRGYAVLAIDAYCFGERHGKGPGSDERGGAGELTASKWNLWFGRSLWGMMLRDDLMALDILASRPEVDASRLGATGISMGATRTWWLMALDDRIRAGVAVACLTRYQDLIEAGLLKAHGIYYYVPGMLQHFDTEAVVSLIAPRAVLFLTGDQDGGSPVPGIRRIEAVAGEVWRLYGKPGSFESRIYPGLGHVYTPDMWERMLAWMGKHL